MHEKRTQFRRFYFRDFQKQFLIAKISAFKVYIVCFLLLMRTVHSFHVLCCFPVHHYRASFLPSETNSRSDLGPDYVPVWQISVHRHHPLLVEQQQNSYLDRHLAKIIWPIIENHSMICK